MKSSRFVCADFQLKTKIAEKNQTLSLALNCYFFIRLKFVIH